MFGCIQRFIAFRFKCSASWLLETRIFRHLESVEGNSLSLCRHWWELNVEFPCLCSSASWLLEIRTIDHLESAEGNSFSLLSPLIAIECEFPRSCSTASTQKTKLHFCAIIVIVELGSLSVVVSTNPIADKPGKFRFSLSSNSRNPK